MSKKKKMSAPKLKALGQIKKEIMLTLFYIYGILSLLQKIYKLQKNIVKNKR